MKREHQDPPKILSPATMSKAAKMIEEEEPDTGDDELLADLGYKVRASDMADVAQKLEQLDMVMVGSTSASAADQDDATLLSHFPLDSIQYNPSDLITWVDSLLSDVNAPPPPPNGPNPFDFPSSSSSITTVDVRGQKRIKLSSSAESAASSSSSLPLVVVDTQEAGIRLVHTLMAAAEAVQQDNLKAADALVKQISILAASQGGAMRKVSTYFAEALARRIYKLRPQQDCSLESAFSDILHMHFYESCPYLKFAHFTANQAILEAFAGCRRVHVIDFDMKQGMQWPALMQALALRTGGPPSFRLTGIGPPQTDNTDALQQVGWKLAQLADTVHIDFEYRGFVANSLADLEPYLLEISNKSDGGDDDVEAVAVNSIFELHKLLARSGAIEKVLSTIKAIKPKIVTVVEQESNHNSGSFTDRFTEALHYYSTMFDSLEGGGSPTEVGSGPQDQVMSEVYLGRQICNVVACEGVERTERHETLAQWRNRFGRAGFEPVHLGSNAFKQASMLLALFAGGDGYRVEEKEGCLTLGWHTRPLIATSAWRVGPGGSSV